MEHKLFVGSLSHPRKDDDLRDAFGEFGTVNPPRSRGPRNPAARRASPSWGNGFARRAQAAIRGLNGQSVGGRCHRRERGPSLEERPPAAVAASAAAVAASVATVVASVATVAASAVAVAAQRRQTAAVTDRLGTDMRGPAPAKPARLTAREGVSGQNPDGRPRGAQMLTGRMRKRPLLPLTLRPASARIFIGPPGLLPVLPVPAITFTDAAPATHAMTLRYEILPVTAFAQNCSLLWCDETREAVLVDPGGEAGLLKATVKSKGLTLKALWLPMPTSITPAPPDSWPANWPCPSRALIKATCFWIQGLPQQSQMFIPHVRAVHAHALAADGDTVTVGHCTLEVRHCPGHARPRGLLVGRGPALLGR